jgi:hypothetical protein
MVLAQSGQPNSNNNDLQAHLRSDTAQRFADNPYYMLGYFQGEGFFVIQPFEEMSLQASP